MATIRVIIGVVLAYIVTAIIIMLGMLVAAYLMGSKLVFVGDTWQSSPLWHSFALIEGAFAGFFGGVAARWIGGKHSAGWGLAILMIVLGAVQIAVHAAGPIDPNPPPRPEPMSLQDWMTVGNYAHPPLWGTAVMAVLGATTAVTGSRWMGARIARRGATT